MFEKLEKFLIKFIEPMSVKLNNNKAISSITEGFIRTSPITLGIALFAILKGIPVTAWTNYLTTSGLGAHLDAIILASTGLMSLYVSFSIAFCYARKLGSDGFTSGFLSLMTFFILMPQSVEGVDGPINALSTGYLGGDTLFVALIISLVVTKLVHVLTKKGFVFKMSDTVPPMVSESLGSVFIATIIVGIALALRIGFAATDFGNCFEAVKQIIAGPILKLGATIPSIIFLLTLSNLVWFFGIHPNTIQSPMTPLAMTIMVANLTAYTNGDPLPYATLSICSLCCAVGGNGNTLGLVANLFLAKSRKLKDILKISSIPNLFNINEPLIFGLPIMMNPVFFIPFILSAPLMGLTGYLMQQILPVVYNPSSALLPWMTPFFVKAFIGGGINLIIIVLTALAVNIVLFYPFVKMADKKALQEEAELEREKLEVEHA